AYHPLHPLPTRRSSDLTASPPGVLVVNPPYGERLGKNDDLATLYRRLGEIWKERFPGWTGHVLAGNLQLSRSIPLRATDKPKLRSEEHTSELQSRENLV